MGARVHTAGRSLEAILWAACSTKSYWFFSSQQPSLIPLLSWSLGLCMLLRHCSVWTTLPAWLTLGRNADISPLKGRYWGVCVCETVTSWQRHKLRSHSDKTFYSTVRFSSLPGGDSGCINRRGATVRLLLYQLLIHPREPPCKFTGEKKARVSVRAGLHLPFMKKS